MPKRTPIRPSFRKPRADQHSERLVTLLTRRDRDDLANLASREGLGTYTRQIIRAHMREQLASIVKAAEARRDTKVVKKAITTANPTQTGLALVTKRLA